MERKRVLFILNIPPPFGGGEIVSKVLYEKLKNKPNYVFLLFSKKRYNKKLQANTSFYSFYYSCVFILKSVNKIILTMPDAIYIGLPKGFPSFIRNGIIIIVAKLLRKEVYAELHGMSFPFAEKNSFGKYIVLFVLNKVNKIRVLALSIESYLFELGYKGHCFVVNNGIEKPQISNIKIYTDSKLNILYFGAISFQKGFDRVLQILADLSTDVKEKISLNVIGEWVNTDEKVKSFKIMKDNNIVNLINFHGRKLDDDKWYLVRENRLMLHLTNFDGQPMTIIEAMSIGIPAIATKIGAIPEMICNGIDGFLVESNDEVMYIIKNIVNKKIDLQRISKSAILKYEKKYTTEEMVKGIINIIG